MFCLYCCSSNSYITGTFSDSIPAKVFAFTGNGKSSTNQISLSFSLYQPTTIVSSVPLGVVIVSTLFGIKLDTNPPPTGPNAPHDVLLNSCGPWILSFSFDVTYALSHAIDDLNAIA